jgi:hypothetical protein
VSKYFRLAPKADLDLRVWQARPGLGINSAVAAGVFCVMAITAQIKVTL